MSRVSGQRRTPSAGPSAASAARAPAKQSQAASQAAPKAATKPAAHPGKLPPPARHRAARPARNASQRLLAVLGFAGLDAATANLSLAVLVSVLLHGVALLIHFAPPDIAKKLARDRQLEVVLVNARHAAKPRNAQALAQSNLDGGGTVDEDRRATTPLPPSERTRSGDDLVETHRRMQQLERQQRELLARAQASTPLPAAPQQAEQPQPTPVQASGLDLAERAMAVARLEAEIARRVDDYNKRPRKKFVGARTEEYKFARYIEDWRQKVERVGNLNYPEDARGRLYGRLQLTVGIRADGSLERVEINRPSGHKLLDDAAVRIVRLAAPYAAFPANIASEVDVLYITRTWSFTNAGQLATQ